MLAPGESEWIHLTHIELREHWDAVCCERRKAIGVRLDAHDRVHELLGDALGKAEHAVNARLVTMNEMRDQINSECGMLATKESVRAEIATLNAKIDSIDRALSNIEGRAWALTIALPLLISALVSLGINVAGRT